MGGIQEHAVISLLSVTPYLPSSPSTCNPTTQKAEEKQCNVIKAKICTFEREKNKGKIPPVPKRITQKEEENNDNQGSQVLIWRQFILYSFDIISQQVFLIFLNFHVTTKGSGTKIVYLS